jgi:hypothetical protein
MTIAWNRAVLKSPPIGRNDLNTYSEMLSYQYKNRDFKKFKVRAAIHINLYLIILQLLNMFFSAGYQLMSFINVFLQINTDEYGIC